MPAEAFTIPLAFKYPLHIVRAHWGDPALEPSRKFCLIDQARTVVADCYSQEAADELTFLINLGYEHITKTPHDP